MALAKKITRLLIAPIMGASFALATEKGHAGDPAGEQPHPICTQVDQALAIENKVPDSVLGNIQNIYNAISYEGPDGGSLLSIEELKRRILDNEFLSSDEKQGLLSVEIPKIERFINQSDLSIEQWNNLTELQKWLAMSYTLQGLNGLRDIFGDEMEGIDVAISSDEGILNDLVGITEPEDYELLDAFATCPAGDKATLPPVGAPDKAPGKRGPLIG